MTTTWTVKRLLDWTTAYLMENGIESPHLEAEILLAHALKMKRIALYTSFEKTPSPEELTLFKDMIQRRVKKEPIAYITGVQYFMSLEFKVNSSVLIPRPDTETLVEVGIDLAKKHDCRLAADVGTGSGAIAVSLAKYVSSLNVTGIDLCREAVRLAEENARQLGVSERCSFMHGNLFECLEQGIKFDLVVSNPPYIPTVEVDRLDSDIKMFEPKYALDGGTDGLDYFRKIIAASPSYLQPTGFLALEVGFDQAESVKKILDASGNFEGPRAVKDLNDIERVVYAKIKN